MQPQINVLNPNCECDASSSFNFVAADPGPRSAVFGAHFNRVDATAFYPTKPNEAIGGGTLKDFSIKKYSK